MNGVVHKYGGSSVATIEKIKAIAEHVARVRRDGRDIAIVASAMGKTTNELIALAHELSEHPSPRELDSLLSTGEQKTVTLLAMALTEIGIPAVSLTGTQAGFITNRNHSHAKIIDIQIDTVRSWIDRGYVPVLAGFQGRDKDGNITTLGRGGSDTTAVALAAKLKWDCEIYTDVDGVYTVDPRKCPDAKKLSVIKNDEMMEMASLGAGVLETRSVELAKKYGVKLFLGMSLEVDLSKGTYIMNDTFEDMPVTGISIKEDCTMIRVKNLEGGGKGTSRVFDIISGLDINVDMINQQLSDDGKSMLTFSCTEADAQKFLDTASSQGLSYPIEKQSGLTKLSLVGAGMITHSGVAGKAFATLVAEGIAYHQVSTSEISISITVDDKNRDRAVAVLADTFDLVEK